MMSILKQLFAASVIVLCCHCLKAQSTNNDRVESSLRTSQVSTAEATYSYDASGNRIKRILASGGGCTNIWTGNVSSVWSNPGNWSLGTVPQPCHAVVIPIVAGKPNPILDVNSTISSVQLTGGSINMNSFNISFSFDPGCATSCP